MPKMWQGEKVMKRRKQREWKLYYKNKFKKIVGDNMTPEKLVALYGFKLIGRADFNGHIVLKLEDNYELRIFNDHKVYMCSDEARMEEMFNMANAFIVEFETYELRNLWDIKYNFCIDWGSGNESRKAIHHERTDYMKSQIRKWREN